MNVHVQALPPPSDTGHDYVSRCAGCGRLLVLHLTDVDRVTDVHVAFDCPNCHARIVLPMPPVAGTGLPL